MYRPSLFLAVAFAAALSGCGGGSSVSGSNDPPANNPPSNNPPAAASVTITITSAGVDKKQVEIPVGGTVAFVNNDNQFHEMSSNPHPQHTDCPPMGQVGSLGPGRSGVSGAFNTARTCGFHDHGQENNTNLQGTIVIR